MYKILMEATAERLEERVNMWISQGWKPLGGVCVATESQIFYQALVWITK